MKPEEIREEKEKAYLMDVLRRYDRGNGIPTERMEDIMVKEKLNETALPRVLHLLEKDGLIYYPDRRRMKVI